MAAPVISSFQPVAGYAGSEVVVYGQDLLNATFYVNALAVTVITQSDYVVRLTVPAGALSGLIQAHNTDGDGYSPAALIVTTAPVVSSLCSGSTQRAVTSNGYCWSADEAALMNLTQAIASQPDNSVRFITLTHVSAAFVPPTGAASYEEQPAVAHNRLQTLQHVSDRQLDLLVPAQTLAIGVVQAHDRLQTTSHASTHQTDLVSSTQTYAVGAALSHNRLQTLLHASARQNDLLTGSWSMASSETVRYRVAWSDGHRSDDASPPYSLPFELLYGVGNTFYSLYGMFGYLRYAFWSLMATAYHILVGEHGVNLYDSDMNCRYSFRLGLQRVIVDPLLFKDASGEWLLPDQIPAIYQDYRMRAYDSRTKRLCTYDFANVTYQAQKYFLVDSDDLPANVDIVIDSTYGMPYILPRSDQAKQLLTEDGQYWQFLQLNCLKLIDLTAADRASAAATYFHELLGPVDLTFEQIILRHDDDFYALATDGETEKTLYRVNKYAPNAFEPLARYSGSRVLHAAWPHVWYAERRENFKPESPFDRLVKLDLASRDFEVINRQCDDYRMTKGEVLWHVYKRSDNDAWYAQRDDDPDVIHNLTSRFNLGTNDVIDCVSFGRSILAVLTSERQVWTLDCETLASSHATWLTGTPIKLLKFEETVGCVVTRKDNLMLFEQLQQLHFSTDPDDWVTPTDMLPGEILWPYRLATGGMVRRTAPITSVLNVHIAERFSQQAVELEFALLDKISFAVDTTAYAPIRVGRTEQQLKAAPERSQIAPVQHGAGSVQYNAPLKVERSLNDDGSFHFKIEDLPFPEVPGLGFKIYEK